tara:strand:- start:378 stop:494 length:117 start_codon:yes stop_codon:yes gene_type:complete
MIRVKVDDVMDSIRQSNIQILSEDYKKWINLRIRLKLG